MLQKIGCSLSVYNASQILKLGTSVDYVVCKGTDCKNVINRYTTPSFICPFKII